MYLSCPIGRFGMVELCVEGVRAMGARVQGAGCKARWSITDRWGEEGERSKYVVCLVHPRAPAPLFLALAGHTGHLLLCVHADLKSAPKRWSRPHRRPPCQLRPPLLRPPLHWLPILASPGPSATADSAAAAAETSAGDVPVPPAKRGRGCPGMVSSAFPERVRPSSSAT